MKKRTYDRKSIKNHVLVTLKNKGYQDIRKNISINNKKYDYTLYLKNKVYAVVIISVSKKLGKNSVLKYAEQLENSNVQYIFISNNIDLVTYNTISCETQITKISNFPERIELEKTLKTKKSFLYLKILLAISLLLSIIFFIYVTYESINQNKIIQNNLFKIEEQERLNHEYQTCIETKQDDIKTEQIEEYEKELEFYLKKYNVSIYYENINLGYNFSYNETKVYYAASVIKMLDALYIYDEARLGKIDLNTTIKYTRKYLISDSDGVKTHKLNDDISLKDLVSYAILYSDNAAHAMLIDYIGFDNLKKYGNDLGAKYTLYGTDTFGSINTTDAKIYLNHLYDFLKTNDEYTDQLKKYFINSKHNNLSLKGIDAATKYGYYGAYFHNIGIVFDDSPYIVAILTTEASGNFDNKVKDINAKIYELHRLYYANHISTCYDNVYEKKAK